MALKNNSFKTCWESISTFFLVDAAFRDDISDNMKNMWDMNADVVQQWFEAAAYQGFDVKAFLTLLIKFRKEYYEEDPAEEVWDVKYDSAGQTKRFSYTSKEPFMKDMCFMILIVLQRGSSWDKISDKTNPGTVQILNHMKAKYRINAQMREAGSSLSADMVTVPRIAACFPVRILQFIEMGVGRVIIDKAQLIDDHIPRWLLHPAAASVLPVRTSSKLGARLIIVTLGVCVLTDDLLHKKDGKFTPLYSILSYPEAARQTAAVPEKARIEFLRAVKIFKKHCREPY